MKRFFLSYKFIVPVLILLAVGGFVYSRYKKANQPPVYETVKVESETIKQTVDATGKVESLNDVSLRFEMPGTISRIEVKEGSQVVQGQLLANLRMTELEAAVAQAQANLNQRLAGATEEDKKFFAAAVESAQASLEQSRIDVQNSHGEMVINMQGSLPKLDDALTQSDNILGVDNSSANADFKAFLSVLNQNNLTTAISEYPKAKRARDAAKDSVLMLNAQSSPEKIFESANLLEAAYNEMTQLLVNVSDVLKASVPNGTFTQTVLDSKKSLIENTRTSLAASYGGFVKQRQSVKALENAVKLKQAAYDQAVANYESKTKPPREVDVAGLRAALAQAIGNRDKAVIRSPISGMVTKVNKKVGETVSGAETIIQILSPNYAVKVDIPETDVSKINLNDTAQITLDAFGDDVKFNGKILTIDPGATEIQDVVYYKVTVSLEDSGQNIKPGMTANVSVATEEKTGALSVPFRSIRTRDDGARYVKLLKNGVEEERNITIGIRANEGKVEVLSGLSEGDEVILSVK